MAIFAFGYFVSSLKLVKTPNTSSANLDTSNGFTSTSKSFITLFMSSFDISNSLINFLRVAVALTYAATGASSSLILNNYNNYMII